MIHWKNNRFNMLLSYLQYFSNRLYILIFLKDVVLKIIIDKITH